MKQIRHLIGGLLACGMVLAMATNLAAQTVQEGIAKVIAVKGNARYMTAGGTAWQSLEVGIILKSGAVVQTASRSSVDIVFNNSEAYEPPVMPMGDVMTYQPKAEQDAVRIMEDTVLGIDKLTIAQTGADTVTETQLDLKAGRIFGTVKKLSAASKYEVKIPNGVAGIRGTIYYLSADGILTVIVGSVVIAYVAPDGTLKTQVVTAGQQYDARTGEIIPIPPLLEKFLYTIANELRCPPPGPVTIPEDHRIHHVSPTHGHGHGHGHGRGND